MKKLQLGSFLLITALSMLSLRTNLEPELAAIPSAPETTGDHKNPQASSCLN